jgi:isoleucyl-tRNA synthetase
MGADVMRWQYCRQPPDRNLLFGYGPAHQIKRKLLTLWNSASFLVTYAAIENFRPQLGDLDMGPPADDLRPLDRWLLARVQDFILEATSAYEQFMTVNVIRAFEDFVDDLSNWYIRRNRSRFWQGDAAAFRTLWYALVQSLRVVAPVMPFLTEHLWRELVAETDADAPESVFLAGWPLPIEQYRDQKLLLEVAEARRVVELAHAARQKAGMKLRQPLRSLVVATSEPAKRSLVARQAEELAGELRVKKVKITESADEVAELRATPRLDIVGPRLGPDLPELRRLLAEGSFQVQNGSLRAGGFVLAPGEFTLEYAAREGWAVAHETDYVVAVDTRLDEELELEGRALDLIHMIQRLRKEAGLEITDRVVVTVPANAEGLLAHEEWIKAETLATRIELGDGLAVAKA